MRLAELLDGRCRGNSNLNVTSVDLKKLQVPARKQPGEEEEEEEKKKRRRRREEEEEKKKRRRRDARSSSCGLIKQV